MKKYISIAFALIFILFGIGSGVVIYHLLSTTANLRYLINLHEIEDIRQELSFSLLKVQSYTFSSPAYFANQLDEIIENADLRWQGGKRVVVMEIILRDVMTREDMNAFKKKIDTYFSGKFVVRAKTVYIP